MAKNIVKSSRSVENKFECKTSMLKVVFVILAGLLFGYFVILISGQNLIGITPDIIFSLIILVLLTCGLALLLDIRRFLLK